MHITRPDGVAQTAVLDWVPDPIAVRDLINRAIHEMRVLVHGRQVNEHKDVSVHRFDTHGGFGWTSGTPAPPPLPTPAQPPAVQQPSPPPTASKSRATTPAQVMALLKQLGGLRDAGVVTPEEFEAKKKDLLDRI
ncbi:MAG TPA: SHOCT domain-containing protein [Spirillospora sp.]|nr:SHOCT domain-containing protein [Spirillospora sp.]